MSDAWMQRGAERQEFLDKLKRYVMDEEEESHQRLSVQIPFTIAILAHLNEREGTHVTVFVPEKARTFLNEKILPEIREFSRTPEEAFALLGTLFEWECRSIARNFHLGLQTQEIMEPEKVFEESEETET